MTDGEASSREDSRAARSSRRVFRRGHPHHPAPASGVAASGVPKSVVTGPDVSGSVVFAPTAPVELHRETSAQHSSVAHNFAGQGAIREFLHLQSSAPVRSRLARLFGVSPLVPDTRVWYEAASSEIEVGEELEQLNAEWFVLHALPVTSSGHIDHVVIGPGGVFILTTKSHPGQTVWASQRAFLVSGMRHPYIRNMEYEMGRAERLLTSAADTPVEVAGVLVIAAAKSITVRDKHRDVTVLPTSAVVPWLLSRPAVLTTGDVARIGAAARRETTWYIGPRLSGGGAPGDRGDSLSRFAAHRAEVRTAWRRQVLWAAGTAIAGAGGFLLVTYSILVGALGSLAQH
jgi:hypothetical protein